MRTSTVLAGFAALLSLGIAACSGPDDDRGSAPNEADEALFTSEGYTSTPAAEEDLQAKVAGRTLKLTEPITLERGADGSLVAAAFTGRFTTAVHVSWSEGAMERTIDEVVCDLGAVGEGHTRLAAHSAYVLFPTRAWVRVHAEDATGANAGVGFEFDANASDGSGLHFTCVAPRVKPHASRYFYEM